MSEENRPQFLWEEELPKEEARGITRELWADFIELLPSLPDFNAAASKRVISAIWSDHSIRPLRLKIDNGCENFFLSFEIDYHIKDIKINRSIPKEEYLEEITISPSKRQGFYLEYKNSTGERQVDNLDALGRALIMKRRLEKLQTTLD